MTAVAMVLIGAGVLVALLSSIGSLMARTTLNRLHFVTPMTSIAAPMIGLGLAIVNGFSLTSGTILLTVAIVTGTGPVLTAATGRMTNTHDEEQA